VGGNISLVHLAVDSAAHVSEEVRNASHTVPWTMFAAVALNGFIGLGFTITFVFVIQNLETQIVQSTSPYPFVGVLQVAVGSKAGAIGMTVPIIILLAAACINR
jgi:choline transport protein